MKLTEQRKKGEVTQLDKINMVVKIQAVFRGYLARKYVKEVRSQKQFEEIMRHSGGNAQKIRVPNTWLTLRKLSCVKDLLTSEQTLYRIADIAKSRRLS